ncbi:UNVERIFIED_CONTAM: hypothetical protein Slati_3877000 [Sesamum latifolium]|uniref:Aminotransferase-like plant mobile domain-containing protein n=1 Tax=Sesamum latifolium TaxID=2727402 RepID=A0AAW2TPX6_9LAMI
MININLWRKAQYWRFRHPLVSGRNVSPWPRLTNSFYLDEWSQEVSLSKNVKAWTLRATHHELSHHQRSNDLAPLRTLGRSIVEGDAKWDGDIHFIEEFHYTKGYWEWTKDVLSRCGKRLRLINAYDAVYASRFTYDHNSDIIKTFCEAWCPLTNTLLTSVRELSISLWDLHDLAGLPMTGCFYDEVLPSALELTGADKKGVPKEKKWFGLNQLTSDITTHKRWSTAKEALFEKLCIEGNLKEEVYLAVYLACWLCTFVLLGKDVNSIRLSTYKMASMMANDRRVSLAIPVLTSIYEGLNIIASSSTPARTSPSFPVHFVYAWLASYFKTHYPIWQGLRGPKMIRFSGEGGAKYYDPQEARKRIYKAEFVSWACNMIVKNRPFKFIDNGDAEELDHDYFSAIHSSYLTLHQAQSQLRLPSNVKKYEDEQVDGENNPPHVFVPSIVVKSNSQAVAVEVSKGKGLLHNLVDSDSSNIDRHWKRQKKELTPLKAVEASASRSPSADFVAQLEDEIQSIDASEESETSHSWTTTPPPFGIGLKENQLPQPPAVSVLEEFSQVRHYEGGGIIEHVFVKVRAYDEARSLSSQKLSRSLHEQHLKEARARLQNVQVKASEGASKVQPIVDELEYVEKEIVALKGRRTSLRSALKEQKQLNHDAQAKVHEVEEDIATLDNAAPLDDAIVEDSKANLEILKEDLKSLKSFA